MLVIIKITSPEKVKMLNSINSKPVKFNILARGASLGRPPLQQLRIMDVML